MTEGGYVFGFGTGAPGDVKTPDAMEKAYQMGKAERVVGNGNV